MEDVLILYIDLDRLIAVCGLSELEELVVEYMMRGYTIQDIADSIGGTRQAYGGYYRRAVKKIVKEFNDQWAYWHGGVLAKENPRYCV